VKSHQAWQASILVLILVSAFAYLPLINQFGYTHDDWYLMASARAEGPGVFREIFSVDRPLRALVMIPAYTLFGENALYYNLSAYLFRVIGALALFWILSMLWTRQHMMSMMMALLFLIYPGFLSQTNGIDYQSHIVGLAAALLSIALTIRAAQSENRITQIMAHAFSILLGWFYLGQMEWYIGIEFFRWACIFLLASRHAGTIFQKALRTLQTAYSALAIPLVFLIWRIFFFKAERGATDVNIQFENLRLYPIQMVYHWSVQVLQDLFDVFLSAWAIPLSQLANYIQVWGVFIAILVASLFVFFVVKWNETDPQEDNSQFSVSREAILLGLFTAIAGLIPIAMVNREVSFPAYSRYSLISSIGVAIFIVAVLTQLKAKLLRNGIIAGLIFISVLVQHANAVEQARETSATNLFWWQLSWRVPQFEKNTTLVASYPAIIEEDYFIWGPASLIYYPEKQNPKVIQPGIFAIVLNADAVQKIQAGEKQEYDKRKNIITYKNYRNLVVLTQPSANTCVHVINGGAPEYTQGEWDFIQTVKPYSEIDHVLVDETPHTPPEVIFGPEPVHGWCYYYQKADLARQTGDWDQVIEMGNQASALGFSPTDLIEWMPFLQAYAQTADIQRLTNLAPMINSDPYVSKQACQILSSMKEPSESVLETIHSQYCSK